MKFSTHSLTFFTILMHSLGDVWNPGSEVPCFIGGSLWGLTVMFFTILMDSLGDAWRPGSGVSYLGGFAALGGPQSHFLHYPYDFLGWRLGAYSLTFFTIFIHSLLDVWHPGSGIPCFARFAAFGGLQSHFLHYHHAFLGWRLASWLWGSVFHRFCSLWGLTVSCSSLS